MKKNIILLIVAAIVLGLGYWWYINTDGYRKDRLIKQMRAAYENDTYGGSTPEETLALFIDALKKGDTDLASRYFLIEYQSTSLTELQNIKQNGNIQNMIDDLSRLQSGKELHSGTYQYVILRRNSTEVERTISVIKNSNSGKWKLDRMF